MTQTELVLMTADHLAWLVKAEILAQDLPSHKVRDLLRETCETYFRERGKLLPGGESGPKKVKIKRTARQMAKGKA